MRNLAVLTALILLFILPCAGRTAEKESKSATEPKKDERFDRTTPEGTLRVFTLAVLAGNKELIKGTAVPVSEEDMVILSSGVNYDPKPTFKELKADVGKMEIKTLKVGDVVTLPGNKKVTVGDDEIGDDKMILLLEGSEIPTRMYKAQGYWWVDASPVIAGRKAAKKNREEKKLGKSVKKESA